MMFQWCNRKNKNNNRNKTWLSSSLSSSPSISNVQTSTSLLCIAMLTILYTLHMKWSRFHFFFFASFFFSIRFLIHSLISMMLETHHEHELFYFIRFVAKTKILFCQYWQSFGLKGLISTFFFFWTKTIWFCLHVCTYTYVDEVYIRGMFKKLTVIFKFRELHDFHIFCYVSTHVCYICWQYQTFWSSK